MNHVLFLECSPYGLESSGARQALAILRAADAEGLRMRITTRCLAGEALAPLSAQYARAVTTSAPADDPAFVLSECLIRELESSDGLLISTPMHNFTVPAALKLWIDHVVRKGRTFTVTQNGKMGLLRDRPTWVLLRSGGAATGEDSRQPDFLTHYVRHILAVIGIHDVHFAYLPGASPTAHALAQTRRSLTSFLIRSLTIGEIS